MERDNMKDGGYGWVVVGSAFTVSLITGGIKFSFGLMLPVLIDVFLEATAPVAAIGGTFLGSVALSAPFAGSLSDAFGRRYVTIVGTLVFSCGLFCSAFVPNIGLLYFTYGILCGVGYGLMLTAPLACVMEHFTKKRALAVGMAISGAGIGTFVMNQLTNLFLQTYGWNGTFILLSGISLNGIACGLALPNTGIRIKPIHNTPKYHVEPTQEYCNESVDTVCADPVDNVKTVAVSVDTLCSDSVDKFCVNSNDKSYHDPIDKACAIPKEKEHVDLNAKVSVRSSIESTVDSAGNHCDQENVTSSDVSSDDSAYKHCFKAKKADTQCDKSSVDASYKHKLEHMKHDILGIMFGNILTVLRDFECLCILLSCLSYGLGFFVPFSFLPKQALSMGMDSQQEVWLMSAIGIANTVFRWIFGWIGTKLNKQSGVMHFGIMLLVSVSLSTSVLLTTFETKMIFACVYGALFGSYYAIVPVRLASKVSVDNVGKTTGLFLSTMNGANIVGMPLAGWTIDVTGDYVVCFLLAGGESLIAAFFIILPQLRTYICQRRTRVETTHL